MPDLHTLFQEFKGKKIALYGLGTETKKAIEAFEDSFEIIGLLDSFRESGEMYEKDILSLQQVLEAGTEIIIVVARPGSCKAIANRIGAVCRERGIILMDIRGKDLLADKEAVYHFSGMKGQSRRELYQKIARADIISFDLFDTLVMRETLFYTDVFELADCALRQKGILIPGFAHRRLKAEKDLSKAGAPKLEMIYESFLDEASDVPISPSELARLEWEIDFALITPRQALCDIFCDCVRQGKEVYIVTDSYYRAEQIEAILKKCNLTGYRDVIVSCEHNMGKTQGLLERLKGARGSRYYLHIGDDPAADMEAARKAGMDTCHILSGEELLDAVGYMGMGSYVDTLADRIKLGMFTARLFNDPFCFESESGVIQIDDAHDIGYLICAPMITDFLFWFQSEVRKEGLPNIWFSARDGYLLQKLFQILDDKAASVYFLTSRMAAIRAGIEGEKDIAYVDSMKFSGTLEENLKTRFGIEAVKSIVTDNSTAGLMQYRDAILGNAEIQKERYKKYINGLNVKNGNIVFFDFVAKGTVQMYIQRIVKNHIKGLYFMQLEPGALEDENIDIVPFYRPDEIEGSAIFDEYYILETILTAPHPYVCEFDEAGRAVYAEEARSEQDIRCFLKAQEGITEYFRKYLGILPENGRTLDKKLDEIFLGLFYKLKVTDRDFLSLVVEDPFFNRMTKITDLF